MRGEIYIVKCEMESEGMCVAFPLKYFLYLISFSMHWHGTID